MPGRIEEKLDFIITNMKAGTAPQQRQRAFKSGFATPKSQKTKEDGQNERNVRAKSIFLKLSTLTNSLYQSFVRASINAFMGINKTKGILEKKDEIYAINTPIKNQIRRFENTGASKDEPDLEPMIINFDRLRGRWNEAVFAKFLSKIEEDGYNDDEPIPQDEADKIELVFYRRLERMLTELNKNRPIEDEDPEETEERVGRIDKRVAVLSRRNARRNQVKPALIASH